MKRELIVDNFAGGGGASTGIWMALGRSPDMAINHNPAALALHAANHPETLHLSENIYKVDPLDHLKGETIGLVWFSPDCKHFSKAKGGAPVERNIRDLAHVIPHWVERMRKGGGDIRVIAMENVVEFTTWGPLHHTDKGLMPDPARVGETFKAWCKQLRKLGGVLEFRELRACDYGAPTIRKRLFVVIRFDGQPIVWPEPTHGAPDDSDVIAGRKQPWRTAAEIIDWSLPCPSIFDSGEAIMAIHGLRAVRPLAPNTMARVARGMKRYVLDAERPFLVNLTHGARCEDIADPFNTITGAHRGEKAVISPSVIRFNTGATGQDLREPLSTITANSFRKRPGGAAPLGVIAPHLSAFYGPGDGGQDRSADIDEPLRTVTTENRHAVVAPHLMSMKGSDRRGSPADAPHPTVLAGGGHSAVIAPVLSYAQQGGNSRSVEDPVHTICASDKDQNQVMAAMLVQTGYGEREGQEPRALDPGKPLGTIVAGGVKHAAAAAFLAQNNYMEPGHDAREPVSTIVARGCTQSVVSPFLQKYYGTGDGSRLDEPCHTVTVKDRHGHVEAVLDAPPFTSEMETRARDVADFMRAHGFWDDREFVTLGIGSITFVIVDIGMRMLSPRELYNAQGFPGDYEISRGADGETFSKSVQVSCVGNSVSPPVAQALVAANCGWLAEMREAAE